MANIIISQRTESKGEAFIARSFGANTQSKEQREHVECIAARTKEALGELKRMEDRRK